jgi:hypothetical protein
MKRYNAVGLTVAMLLVAAAAKAGDSDDNKQQTSRTQATGENAYDANRENPKKDCREKNKHGRHHQRNGRDECNSNPAVTPTLLPTPAPTVTPSPTVTPTPTATPTTTPIATKTPAQEVKALEDQGEIPLLDRSASIPGTDMNSDSIRDDVNTYINSLQISADQKSAVNQLAKAVQGALLADINDAAVLRKASTDISRSVQCMSLRFPDIKQRSSVIDAIEKVSVNTKERSMQYIKFNNALSGTVSKLLSENTCGN